MAQIKLSIMIDASLEKIYPLVSAASGFSQWWAADVTEAGGFVDLGFSIAQPFTACDQCTAPSRAKPNGAT